MDVELPRAELVSFHLNCALLNVLQGTARTADPLLYTTYR